MLAVLLTTSLPASAACDGAGFVAVDRPIDPADPAAGSFAYRIRVEPGTDAAAAPVVFLPGGPGFAVLEQGRAYGVIPPAFTVVTTELRGVGCNALPGPPAAASADTATHAEDVLAALAAAGIDRFTVYGHSYGTVLGTRLASLAEQRGMRVQAVVLESVVGKSWTEGDPWFAGFAQKWETLRGEPAAARLRRRVGRMGLTPEQWGDWAFATLGAGSDDGSPDPVVALGTGPRAALRDAVLAASAPAEAPAGEVWALRDTMCRELVDDAVAHARLGPDGHLEPIADACADVQVDRPYDPAQWPLRAPLVYLVGGADPVTPWARGRDHHLSTHPEAPRTVVVVPGAGHYVAHQLGDCVEPVMTAVLAGRAPTATDCSRPLAVEIHPGMERPGR